MNPKLLIGKFCRECSGTFLDCKFCSDPDCLLWPYRLGPEAAAAQKYGKEIFEKKNFRNGEKFASPEDARLLEAKYFRNAKAEGRGAISEKGKRGAEHLQAYREKIKVAQLRTDDFKQVNTEL